MSNSYPRKRVRFETFVTNLRSARPATDRGGALLLMMQVMEDVENQYDLPDYERMRVFSFDFGWENLERDPCYWDDRAGNRHRVYIYDNGRILIKRLPDLHEVVIDKPGDSTR